MKPPAARGPVPRRAEDDGFLRQAGAGTGTAQPTVRSPDAEEVDIIGPGRVETAPGAAERGTVETAIVEASSDTTEPATARSRFSLRDRAQATLRIIRSNPTGRIALKVFIGIAGALVVAIGLALIPLPGPGWALVILGLAIWAIEFAWAKHLLTFTRSKVRMWTDWVKRQSLPLRLLLGLVGMVFVGAVVVVSLRVSFGIDVIADVWDYVTTH